MTMPAEAKKRVHITWREARSGAIQDGGAYTIRTSADLESVLRILESAGQADTFDIHAYEFNPLDGAVIQTLADQHHGYPEDLFDELRKMFPKQTV